MGRRSKLTDDMQKQICDNLALGMTVGDICDLVGLNKTSYYTWKNTGEAVQLEINQLLSSGVPETDPEVEALMKHPYLNFLDAVIRSEAQARQTAVAAIKSGQVGGKSTLLRRDRVEETKLRKVIRFEPFVVNAETGETKEMKVIEEVPYQHIKVTTSEIEEQAAPDWRAGMEFMRRRSPKHWSGEQSKSDDWRSALLELVRSDEVNYGDLEAQVGSEIAMELFQSAGKQVLRLNE